MLECILTFRSGLAMTLAKEGSELCWWMGPLCDYDIPFMYDIAIRPTDKTTNAMLGMRSLAKYDALIQCPVSDMNAIAIGERRIEPSSNNIYYCKPVLRATLITQFTLSLSCRRKARTLTRRGKKRLLKFFLTTMKYKSVLMVYRTSY